MIRIVIQKDGKDLPQGSFEVPLPVMLRVVAALDEMQGDPSPPAPLGEEFIPLPPQAKFIHHIRRMLKLSVHRLDADKAAKQAAEQVQPIEEL